MADGENTPAKHRGLAEPWKPGQSGNPAGKPKGSRNKLGEEFIAKLYADFEEHGVAVITKVREDRPHEYLKVIAGILPKEVKIERMDNMSDDDITKRIRQLATDLGVALSFVEGTGDVAPGEQAPPRTH